MPGRCAGNGADHCCYVEGLPCRFVEENTVEGRRWACGLRRELGDWDLVLTDSRYTEGPGKVFARFGYDCKTFPLPGQKCSECGHGMR